MADCSPEPLLPEIAHNIQISEIFPLFVFPSKFTQKVYLFFVVDPFLLCFLFVKNIFQL